MTGLALLCFLVAAGPRDVAAQAKPEGEMRYALYVTISPLWFDPGETAGQLALVDVAGEPRKVNVGMLPDETFDAGDWVIIHMGFALEKTDAVGAAAALDGLKLMGNSDGAGP